MVREVQPNGTITTIAGNGTQGYTGDGEPALNAEIGESDGIAVFGGKIYLAEGANEVIRVLSGVPVNPGPPTITSGGVVSASAFGEFASAAPGSWIEIYGANLAVDTRSWQTSDFNGVNAPTSLDGTSVTIGGQPAFVDYISPTQVNVQVPNVTAGTQPLVVTTGGVPSAGYNLTVLAINPGLLAPANFKINGTQYISLREGRDGAVLS